MKTRTLITVAIAAVCFTACKEAGKGSKLRIAVIPKGNTHIYWKSVEAGAMKAAKEINADVTFIGPQKEDDRNQQIDLVNTQALQNDAIVLAPLDAVALRDSAKQVADSGKPVIIIDSALNDSSSFVTSVVSTDNREGGRLAARQLAKALNGTGSVAMMRYMQGSASTQEREDGFLEEIKKSPGIKIETENQYAGATASQAQETAMNLLQKLSTADGSLIVQGIYCPNQTTTYGMLQALISKNLAGKVKFVGFDCDTTFIEALKNNSMQGIVLQDPVNMGYLSVKAAAEKLQGGTPKANVDTGATTVTPENLNEEKIQALINTQLAK